ncbi:[LysW]-aminoadipate kinase [Candidatus Woesearchaeota archaeon]|nr:[LysW]-aminoadipate kinase [Candidatus Woesearchaeota archaeon]
MMIIKIGGGKDIKNNLDNILSDIANLNEKVIIVHGANHEMKIISEKLGKPERIVKSPSGFTSRYTDKETIEIFEMVYSGIANKRIVQKLQKLGVNALGLSGLDGRLLVGKRKPYVKIVKDEKIKLLRENYTGTVEKINSELLNLLIKNDYVPVIAPPAISFKGEPINVDNDRIVGALCKGIKTDTIISLFEAPGLLKDLNDPDSLINKIDKDELENYMKFAKGRMKKKIHHAQDAFENDLRKIIFSDGRTKNPVTDALDGRGTIIE